MGERTKQILIITVGIVLLAGGFLYYVGPKSLDKVKCPDGSDAYVVNPDKFLLKYSGKQLSLDANVGDKLKVKVGVSDEMLQRATTATQLLDQRLRVLVMEQVPSACEPRGKELFRTLGEYSSNEFAQLLKLSGELGELASTGGAADKTRAQKVLSDTSAVAEAAQNRLNGPATGHSP
jgi:hypothetical protein